MPTSEPHVPSSDAPRSGAPRSDAHRSEPRDPWQWRRVLLAEQRPAPAHAQALPVTEAVGRILAHDVLAPADVPAVPVAAMDGFAVRRSDLTADGSTILPVSADLPARPGEPPHLAPGTAARIMTGAPVPIGADAVIEVESTDADPIGPCPQHVELRPATGIPPVGRHVRGVGEEVARGTRIARAGDVVGPGLVGLAHALGITVVMAAAAPRVLVLVTGDELASPFEPAAPGTVRESNGAMLVAALTQYGAHARTLRVGDDPATLRTALAQEAPAVDLVVTTGGIGHGAYDVVKAALGDNGSGTSRFSHLALRPGGPQGRGHLHDGTPIVHLPGTPVGALVGFHLFVRPLLVPAGAAEPIRARLCTHDAAGEGADGTGRGRTKPGLHVQAGRLGRTADEELEAEVLTGRRLAPYGRADALVLLDRGTEGTARVGGSDEHVRVLPL